MRGNDFLAPHDLYYVASPYSHKSKKVMRERFIAVTKVATRLMLEKELMGLVLPITTSAVLKAHEPRLGTTWDYWEMTDTILLLHCDALLVVTLDGWKSSVGVQAEMALAIKEDVPIYLVDPETLEAHRFWSW